MVTSLSTPICLPAVLPLPAVPPIVTTAPRPPPAVKVDSLFNRSREQQRHLPIALGLIAESSEAENGLKVLRSNSLWILWDSCIHLNDE